jgi:hypothetical protein
LWDSDQAPNPAEATAAHMHNTPAINMASQYEPDSLPARRAPGAFVSWLVNALAGT